MTKMNTSIKFLVLSLVLGLGYCNQRIDIVLSGRDIPSHDVIWGSTEPYIKVLYKFDSSQNYISYGQTTVSKNNPNPDWPQVFSFDYSGGMSQIVKYDMYDEDVMFHDHIGVVELPLGEIVNDALANSGMVEREFSPENRGRLLMKVRIDGVIPDAHAAVKPDPIVKLLKQH